MRKILMTAAMAGLISVFGVGASGAAFAEENSPLKILVSLKGQHMKVYRGTQLVASSNISSGKSGHETPTGIFSVMEKRRHHKSNIYSNAPMPFMQRLTWSGIALHASDHVPRHPASHGCIRMPHAFADKLFRMQTHGVHVIIEENPQAPRNIRHENLFQPEKPDPEMGTEPGGDQNAKRDNAPARIFITRRTAKDDLVETQRLLNKLGFDAGEVDGFMGPATWAAIAKFREEKGLPAGKAVDNALLNNLYDAALELRPPNGRLLVRKRQKTVYQANFLLREPHRPLGSHLFTAHGFDSENQRTDWAVTSLADRVQGHINLNNGKNIDQATRRQSAEETLARLVIFPHIRKRVNGMLTQGSSLTISDNGLSEETGEKGTDFIVLTKPGTKIVEPFTPRKPAPAKAAAKNRPSGLQLIAGN